MKSIIGLFKKALFVIALCAFLVPATTHASFLGSIKNGLQSLGAQIVNIKDQLAGSAVGSLEKTREVPVRSTVVITSLKNDLGEGVAGGFTRDAVAIKKLLLEKSLRGSTTTGVPLSVDLKINGSDTPAAVVDRSKMTATWTTTGASICFAAGHNAPTWDKSTVWPQVTITPGSGSQDLMAALAFNGNMSDLRSMTQLTIMLQCFGEDGSNIVDQVVVPVVAAPVVPVKPVRTISTEIPTKPIIKETVPVRPIVTPIKPIRVTDTCTIKSLTADPKTVNPRGSSIISWTTTGCTSVKIGDDSTVRPANGSMSTGPLTRTTTYTIKASDINGKITTLGGPVYEGPVFPVIVRVKTTPITTPSITVLSPNGGDVYGVGMPVRVTWSTEGYDANSQVTLDLITTVMDSGINLITTKNDGQEIITIPSISGRNPKWDFGPYYKIRAKITDGTHYNYDDSDKVFTLDQELPDGCTVLGDPSVTVLSPNGGEVYQAGQQVTVKWKTCNVPVNVPIMISTEQKQFNNPFNMVFSSSGYTSVNDGSEEIILPTKTQYSNMEYGKNFVIAVGFDDPIGQKVDRSDDTFTIDSTGINLPSGCTSNSGYSSTTGQPCTTTVSGGRPIANISRLLGLTDKGDDVIKLQNRLTTEGVYSGPISGYYGQLTKAAVAKFQQKYGLSPIGVVGIKTLAILNK